MIGHFRRVAMREKAVSAEILVHLDEMRFALRFFARAVTPDLQSHTIPRAMLIQPASTSGRRPRITDVG